MMIGDQHVDPEFVACSTPSTVAMPLSTVIRKVGLALRGKAHDLRRETVAEFETVGDDVIDVAPMSRSACRPTAQAVAPSES